MLSVILAASIMSQPPWSSSRLDMDTAFMAPPYQAYLAEKQVMCGQTPEWVAIRMESIVGLRQVQLKQKYGLNLSQFQREAREQAALAKKAVAEMSCSMVGESAAAIEIDALRLGGP